MNFKFTSAEFRQVDGDLAKALFKLTAHKDILTIQGNKHDNDKEEKVTNLSLKYQVLSNYTALVGMIKQKDKVTGEMKQIE